MVSKCLPCRIKSRFLRNNLKHGKFIEVNTDSISRVVSQSTGNLPATHAAKLVPNVMPSILMGLDALDRDDMLTGPRKTAIYHRPSHHKNEFLKRSTDAYYISYMSFKFKLSVKR